MQKCVSRFMYLDFRLFLSLKLYPKILSHPAFLRRTEHCRVCRLPIPRGKAESQHPLILDFSRSSSPLLSPSPHSPSPPPSAPSPLSLASFFTLSVPSRALWRNLVLMAGRFSVRTLRVRRSLSKERVLQFKRERKRESEGETLNFVLPKI